MFARERSSRQSSSVDIMNATGAQAPRTFLAFPPWVQLPLIFHRRISRLFAIVWNRQSSNRVPFARVNCAHSPRLPNTSNISFDFIEGEPLVISLDLRGFAISSGSACSSGAVEPSHVLRAIGLTDTQARSSIRISLGASNTIEQVDALVNAIVDSVNHLRRISTQGQAAHREHAHA